MKCGSAHRHDCKYILIFRRGENGYENEMKMKMGATRRRGRWPIVGPPMMKRANESRRIIIHRGRRGRGGRLSVYKRIQQ